MQKSAREKQELVIAKGDIEELRTSLEVIERQLAVLQSRVDKVDEAKGQQNERILEHLRALQGNVDEVDEANRQLNQRTLEQRIGLQNNVDIDGHQLVHTLQQQRVVSTPSSVPSLLTVPQHPLPVQTLRRQLPAIPAMAILDGVESSDMPTLDAIMGSLEDCIWRLAAAEDRISDIEPRLGNIEIDRAVEAFVSDDQRPQVPIPNHQVPSQSDHVRQDRVARITRAWQRPVIERISQLEEAQSRMQEHVGELDKTLDVVRASVASEVATSEVAPLTLGLRTEAIESDCDSRTANSMRNESVVVKNDRAEVRRCKRMSSASTILTQGISEKLDESCSSPLEPSVWELVIFVGVHGVPMSDSTIAIALMVSNAFLQALVCVIVMSKFTVDKDMDVRNWRFEQGHWEKYATSSGRSMVDRLCHHDSTLELAGSQVTVFDDVSGWLAPFVGSYSGLALVIWCLLIFFLFIWQEIQSAFRRLSSIIEVQRDLFTRITPTENGFILISVTTGRTFAVICVSLLRVGMALVIAYAGSVWLARTTAIDDLLLNSVALVFVLDIDDVLFETACPRTMKVLTEDMEHLPHPLYLKSRIPMRSFATLIGCMTFLICFYQVYLTYQMDEVQDLETSFCGGNKQFVVGVNDVTDIVISYEGDADQSSNSLMKNVAQDLAAFTQKDDHIKTTSWSQFRSLLLMDEKTSVKAYGKCEDLLPTDGFMLAPLRHVINESLHSCRDMTMAQCTKNSAIVRLACPVTCGCNMSRAASFSLEGCPVTRCTSMNEYQAALVKARTADIHPDILSGMVEWNLYWDAFVRFMIDRPGYNTQQMSPTFIATKFRDLGCEGITFFQTNSTKPNTVRDFFCSETQEQRRPLRPYCPSSCNCSGLATPNDLFCPMPQKALEWSCASVLVGMAYSGPHPNQFRPTVATSSKCKQNISNSTLPTGHYKCRPNAYNQKHEYIFSGSGVQWIIRWETSVNLDWGAMYLGAGIGLRGDPIWTLSSLKTGPLDFGEHRLVSRWFNPSLSASARNSTLPPEHGWLPRNLSNSDADCAWHPLRLQGAADYAMALPEAAICPSGYNLINTSSLCQDASQRMSFVYKGVDSSSTYPHACYAWTTTRGIYVYFNPLPGRTDPYASSICMV